MRRVVPMVMAVAVLVAGGCSSNGREATPRRSSEKSTATTVATTTTTADPKVAVEQAYRAAQEAVDAAGSVPDPDHPELAKTMTGAQLERARAYVTELRKYHRIARGPMELHPVVVQVNGDSAVVHDCLIDRMVTYDAQTAQQTGNQEPRMFGLEVTMRREEGRWKAADSGPKDELCVSG